MQISQKLSHADWCAILHFLSMIVLSLRKPFKTFLFGAKLCHHDELFWCQDGPHWHRKNHFYSLRLMIDIPSPPTRFDFALSLAMVLRISLLTKTFSHLMTLFPFRGRGRTQKTNSSSSSSCQMSLRVTETEWERSHSTGRWKQDGGAKTFSQLECLEWHLLK